MILCALMVFILFGLEPTFVLSDDSRTLKMVHVLYRHGARTPVAFYPTNPIQQKDWPEGRGALTQKGMMLEYELGSFLKVRYINNMKFIHSEYLHKEVYIQSSDVDRCLQSAETQLAGLYPPSGRQVWNKEIAWQPIPVHTVPRDEDPLLNPDRTKCPRRDEIWKKKKTSDAYKEKAKQYQKLFDYATQHCGAKANIGNVWVILDDYICEQAQGFKSPKWVTDKLDDLKAVSNWVYLNKFSGDEELARILGGTMLGKIVNDMSSVKAGKDSKLFKFNIYSGHDTSVMSLAAALDIDLEVLPSFGACFIVELYTDNANNWFVEINYRNDSSGNLIPFSLKGCEHSCPLYLFQSITKNRVTHDQKKDCALEQASDSANNKYFKLKRYSSPSLYNYWKKNILHGMAYPLKKEQFIQDDKPERTVW